MKEFSWHSRLIVSHAGSAASIVFTTPHARRRISISSPRDGAARHAGDRRAAPVYT